MSNDEKPPLPSAALADLQSQIDRVVSIATQGTLEMKRAARLIAANQQLDARSRMQQVDTAERIERQLSRLSRLLGDRPASLTVVQDIPSKDEEDWSLVHIQLPGGKKKLPVPNRVLWAMVAGGLGTLAGWLGHMLMKALSH